VKLTGRCDEGQASAKRIIVLKPIWLNPFNRGLDLMTVRVLWLLLDMPARAAIVRGPVDKREDVLKLGPFVSRTLFTLNEQLIHKIAKEANVTTARNAQANASTNSTVQALAAT
jgi:hypothetical protein